MRAGRNIELSASDLSGFLACRHRTGLDLAVVQGQRQPPSWTDPVLALLQQRGLEHERNYADVLRADGLRVIDLSGLNAENAVSRTREALDAGPDAILQASFRESTWFGRPDVLRRIDISSCLGGWSYEVIDTKLARETRAGTILQLALYSELLGLAQGSAPELFHVVTPHLAAPMQTFRVADFAAYFRLVKRGLGAAARRGADALLAAHYPEPVDHCEICRWRISCDQRRHSDDHLSLVAGSSRLQRRELRAIGVSTLAQLGVLPLPLPFTPRRGAMDTFVRVREQARVQLAGRTEGKPVHELLPIVPDQGLTRLPAPSVGDIFLDLEGDPFARESGREYLFGFVILEPDGALAPHSFWACTDAEERSAFEAVVEAILRSWSAHPGMHVYHYAPYEPAAFKRLMGRHATREAEIDRMLRADLFVDLYRVVRHSVRASVEAYSIKDLEPFYGFARSVALTEARASLRTVERALELATPDLISDDVRLVVEGYNREDCLSAFRLREWLEHLRASVEMTGTLVPRPTPRESAAPASVDERAQRVAVLVASLTGNLPAERRERNADEQAVWLLAHLLDWHRREEKAPWWEFFRLRDLPEEELFAERAALAGLRFVERVGGTVRSPIDRYAYPLQDTDVREDDPLHLTDGAAFGAVEAIDRGARTVDVKKRGAHATFHPTAVFAHRAVSGLVLAEALFRIGTDVAQHGILSEARYGAARQLLRSQPPRLHTGTFAPRSDEGPGDYAVRVSTALDHTVLAIQGPPGAGKTFTGARMICELVRHGFRVGVTAVSHKVIRKLLDGVVTAASDLGLSLSCIQRVKERSATPSSIEETTDNAEALAAVAGGTAHVLGATSWLWARPDAHETVDVLFVDEAGQMSLANVLAASQAARSVVLLGDPQQLEQPQQGTHPEETDCSALEHILQGRQTISEDRGIFLSETWRLAPAICIFTSEVFYEGRLRSLAGLEQQVLRGTAPFEGAGLWVTTVAHEGNQNSSNEEVDVVERVVGCLLAPGSVWIDQSGSTRTISGTDVLVVAPYNSHVSLLAERLARHGVRIGTVDKFQGQEAPVVIYSMATSTPEDAPRGMEFLYSLNRFNVATSRARCACILVASPRLFEPECKSPRQMQLANALCRYRELARHVELP